jgi:TolB-like protein/DNA-binding winged helix-turn-helix (wHTH) protein/Flp pilus assembly protein TadD
VNRVRAATIAFDGWVLDPESGDLERAGSRIRLQEQPLLVLMELIAARGGLVPREQLIAKLWPKGVVDFDTGLNTVIRKLRVALGDTADTPRYIETLPRRGYRFIGTVDAHTDAAAQLVNPAPPLESPALPVGSPAPVAAVAGSTSQPVQESVVTGEPPPMTGPADSEAPRLRSPGRRAGRLPWRALLAWVAVLGVLALPFVWHYFRGVGVPRPQQSTAGSHTAHSIAVLPFVNLSSDKEQEYFADGLAEELLDRLAKTPDLHVIARTSSFSFKGKADDIPTIAAKLGVANILEGSVRKSGNRLRVNAELIRTDTSEHIWSETFERDRDDVFKVQDEIASAVAAALKIRLLPAGQPSGRSELHTANIEAYDLYLQGKESYNQGNAAGYQRAVTVLREAIALDPQYAAAYAALALAEFWAEDTTPSPANAGYERALAAAEKAVALAPEEGAGYSARGFLRAVYRFEFAAAQSDLVKAVTLNAGDANVLHRSAVVLGILGDLPAAIDREQKALTLDPLSAEICMRLAFFYVAAQRFAAARPLYERSLAIAPNSVRAHFNLGEAALFEQRPAEALAAYRATALETFSLAGQAKAEYSLGHDDVSRRILAELVARYASPAAYYIAAVYAWRGDSGKAFEWLERSYAQRDVGFTWIKIDSNFSSLHGDARYRALLRKMDLPD